MELNSALEFVAGTTHGTLITLRRDGRAQSSDVVHMVADGAVKVSVTADRAKTRNITRDGRVVYHVSAPQRWSYISLDGTATLSPVAVDADDDTCRELAAIYEHIAGAPHDDWDDFFAAMIAERRQVLTIAPVSATGQING